MLAILATALLITASQDPTPGIARDLATARRKAIESVHYDLKFRLEQGIDTVRGSVTVEFELRAPRDSGPIQLDFDGAALNGISVNAKSVDLRRQNGHVVIPNALLRDGKNTFRADFASTVASTGTPLTRYRDKAANQDYFYTLVVPADAHRLFPCFDQPDLKATFSLHLEVPDGWHAIGNGAEIADETADGVRTVHFAKSKPLPTYLFAFAAGPFQRIDDAHASGVGRDDSRPLRMYVRKSRVKELERELLFSMHRESLQWLGDYFDSPYPFGKLDFVLLPGFPYGGMEHAGAIFYREASLVFDHVPTESEKIRRSTLIYHEVSHQWFGNLVTMEWFDDLWLKEGFATFVGYTLLDVLEPGKNAWLRFHQRVKPRAYAIDGTRGTTPIYQKLGNLADAKSAYGAIVYNKAPAVLRELHARLGPAVFRRGVQIFLQRHAYGNARWQDLAAALDEASGSDSGLWSTRWILAPGMPRVSAQTVADADGTVTACRLRQIGAQGEKALWPLDVEVMAFSAPDRHETIRARFVGASHPLEELVGKPRPKCLLLNPRDVAYGLFVLDEASSSWICDHAHEIEDLLLRATAMSALYNTLREAKLDPRRYLDVAIRLLERERDPETHSWLLGTVATTMGRYLPRDEAKAARTRVAEFLLPQLQHGLPGLELQTMRFLVRHCATRDVQLATRGVLDGETEVPGLELGRRDRFLLASAMLACGHVDLLLQEKVNTRGQDCGKEIFMAHAAADDPAAKKQYFELYQKLNEPPEQWMQDSLSFFHWPGQSGHTLRYLRPALDMVEWVKANRRIFFMPAWIDAFVNGHSSPEALEIVRTFLNEEQLPDDIRRKVLQSLDGLERAVRIRERWG